jgi:tetratricopeptide (TPR) repeat protein
VGDQYAKARNFDKAAALYQHVIANWPATEYEMWARTGNVRIDIVTGNQTAVEPAVDALIADFNDLPDLAAAVFRIGEEYYEPAFAAENKGDLSQSKDLFRKAIAIWERILTELPESAITSQAYVASAECYRRLGEHEIALVYHSAVVDNWPDSEYAWCAQSNIGRVLEHLKKAGTTPKSEADSLIEDAYNRVLQNYPDSPAAAAARNWFKYERGQERRVQTLDSPKPPPAPR